MNVIYGRYKVVSKQLRDLARGAYGRTPAPVLDPLKTLLGKAKTVDYRPADDIGPQMDALVRALAEKGYPGASPEDVLSYALFPDVALAFFQANRPSQAVGTAAE